MEFSKDLMAASATPMLLRILSHSENYGYAIIKAVKELSDNQINWTEGMLYPVLHRLEKQNYIMAFWRIAETGRKRKYYQITSEGKDYLRELMNQWKLVDRTLQKSLDTIDKGDKDV